jgi:hypothetical protein
MVLESGDPIMVIDATPVSGAVSQSLDTFLRNG